MLPCASVHAGTIQMHATLFHEISNSRRIAEKLLRRLYIEITFATFLLHNTLTTNAYLSPYRYIFVVNRGHLMVTEKFYRILSLMIHIFKIRNVN